MNKKREQVIGRRLFPRGAIEYQIKKTRLELRRLQAELRLREYEEELAQPLTPKENAEAGHE